MNAKKFNAATSREALQMVRHQLGADAVILSNRKVDNGVEIMALGSADLAMLTEPVKTPGSPVKTQNAPVSKPITARRALMPGTFRKFAAPVAVKETSVVRDPEVFQEISPAHLSSLSNSDNEDLGYSLSDRLLKADHLPVENTPVSKHSTAIEKNAVSRRDRQLDFSAVAKVAPVATLAAPVVTHNVTHNTVATPNPIVAEQQGILNEIKSMRNMMQEQIACLSWSDMQQRDPQRSQLLRTLLNAGFSAALSRQLLEKMPAKADISWVRHVLGSNLRVAAQEEDVVVRGGVVALIGPTGVGKTTTTAKLAARAVVRYGAEKVALLTTDSYRIGAHEQLRIYGKILGVEVHAVRDTHDLQLTLSGLKHKHVVLIDTMGLGQRDTRVAEQTEMFNTAGVQRLLLLNATSSGDTLDDVVHKYHGAGVIGCIPTKLDEAGSLGAVLDIAVRHKLALHYITSGQRVPEDLHEVNLEYLLHRTFKSATKTAAFTLCDLEFPALMAGLGGALAAREAYAL